MAAHAVSCLGLVGIACLPGLLENAYAGLIVSVILISTLFFLAVGIENWRILALIWAAVPFANMFSSHMFHAIR